MSLWDSYRIAGKRISPDEIALVMSFTTTPDDHAFFEKNEAVICDSPDRNVSPYTVLFRLAEGATRDTFTIGRYNSCDITIADPSRTISGQHLVVRFCDEHLVVDDVSTNGSEIQIGNRGTQKTHPMSTQSSTQRMMFPVGSTMTIVFGDARMHLSIPSRNEEVFLQKLRQLNRNTNSLTGGPEKAKPGTPTSDGAPPRFRELYHIPRKPIATGGQGSVYKAHRLSDWAVFAAKELKVSTGNSQATTQEAGGAGDGGINPSNDIVREIKALSRLQHPSIVTLVDWYEEMPDNVILVMEYCESGNLQDWLKTCKQEPPLRDIVAQIADGIRVIHAADLVHRDLKPSNILVRDPQRPTVVLADFGLAKSIADVVTACGTPGYIAPEIYRFGVYTEMVDIWSLGKIVRFLLDKVGSSDQRLKKMARLCLAEDPRYRPSADAIYRYASGEANDLVAPVLNIPTAGTPATDGNNLGRSGRGLSSTQGDEAGSRVYTNWEDAVSSVKV